MKKKMSYLVLGMFTALTIGAMTNPTTWVEKMFLPQNNFVNPGFEANDTGICLGDSAGAAPTTDQTCSVTPSLTKAFETTNPISGNRSIKISKAAGSSRQGEFIAIDFTINRDQRSRPNTLEFKYEASANFVYGTASDIQVFIADTTTSIVTAIAPINYLDGSGHFKGQWQASDNRNYQLLLWIPTTTTLAWDLTLDSFKNALSEWVVINSDSDLSTCPSITGTWSTNTTYTCRVAKQGDYAFFDITINLAGAPTSAALTLTLPYTIDLSKIRPVATGDNLVPIDGTGSINDTATNNYIVRPYLSNATANTNIVNMGYISSGSANNYVTAAITQAAPFTFGNTDYINVKFRVPVVGWTSGNSTIGQIYQNVPAKAQANFQSGTYTANTKLSAFTSFSGTGITYSSGNFTVSQPGDYLITGTVGFGSSNNSYQYVTVNGSQYSPFISSVTPGQFKPFIGTIQNLKANDVISIWTDNGTPTNGNGGHLAITKINSPSAFLTINRSTTKYLASNLTSSTTGIAALAMSNLVIGKRYKVDINIFGGTGAGSSYAELLAIHNGSTVGRALVGAVTGIEIKSAATAEFTASATTLTFNFVETGTSTLLGNGTATQTSVTLTELNNTVAGGF